MTIPTPSQNTDSMFFGGILFTISVQDQNLAEDKSCPKNQNSQKAPLLFWLLEYKAIMETPKKRASLSIFLGIFFSFSTVHKYFYFILDNHILSTDMLKMHVVHTNL